MPLKLHNPRNNNVGMNVTTADIHACPCNTLLPALHGTAAQFVCMCQTCIHILHIHQLLALGDIKAPTQSN
jgi:hypothetical protein